MSRERDDTTGQFTEKISTADVLAFIRGTDTPVVTVSEVANEFDCSTEAARQKLVELAEEDKVGRKKVGARAVVWWVKS